MATVRQIDANRSNAQKSTGPRTDTGKAASSRNAFKHGLAGALPHECAGELTELRASLMESWQPANAHELLAVELIADSWIRMQRAARYEAEFLESAIEDAKANLALPLEPDAGNDDRHIALAITDIQHEHAMKMLNRYSERATSKYFKAVAQLQKMQADRRRLEAADQKKKSVRDLGLALFGETHEAAPEQAVAVCASAASTPTPERSASFGEWLFDSIVSAGAQNGSPAKQERPGTHGSVTEPHTPQPLL